MAQMAQEEDLLRRFLAALDLQHDDKATMRLLAQFSASEYDQLIAIFNQPDFLAENSAAKERIVAILTKIKSELYSS